MALVFIKHLKKEKNYFISLFAYLTTKKEKRFSL
jgi:hypothetical protein